MQQLSKMIYTLSIWILTLLVGLMAGVTMLEVVGRNLFGHSFSWSEEVARYTLVWLTFIGVSAVYKRKELVGFDLLMDKIPPKSRTILSALVQLVMIGFILILIYYGFKQSFSRTVMLQHSAGLNLPMYVPYLAIPIGMVMTLVHAIAHFFEQKDPVVSSDQARNDNLYDQMKIQGGEAK
ncbi:TRAP transporter small permease [Ammoniphilus sp. YIM 78166]|uniref:TRAP transporter small permease n=1 Tax=Ammoniphilus sp. YIM 78166 TaxID=1644106 RepID=UPI0010701090|nr:TRAP transporter small permease [Ammoniphilus sp. YIM 78166]